MHKEKLQRSRFPALNTWSEGGKKLRRHSPPARMKASFTWENIRRTNYHHNRRGNSQPRHALTSNTTTINIVMLPPWVVKIKKKTTSVVRTRDDCRWHLIWEGAAFKSRLWLSMCCCQVEILILYFDFYIYFFITLHLGWLVSNLITFFFLFTSALKLPKLYFIHFRQFQPSVPLRGNIPQLYRPCFHLLIATLLPFSQ